MGEYVTQGTEETMPNIKIPAVLFRNETKGLDSSLWVADMTAINKCYNVYSRGKEFVTEGNNGNYTSADLRYKKVASLINKEARFLFSKTPDCKVISEDVITSKSQKDEISNNISIMQTLIDGVLKSNMFSKKLLQAAKDCFIGKRVAIMLNFNDNGITLTFVPSLEFIYETDANNADVITKIVTFYTTKDARSSIDKRIYKKKYEMHEDGFCYVTEEIFDGTGYLVESPIVEQRTEFTYVPAAIIVNDGLIGDMFGESEVDLLGDYESWYSRLANADMDAERQGMNPVRYTVDASEGSTKDLSIAAGAFWDIQTDQNSANQNAKAQAGILETNMNYRDALGATLERINNVMHDTIDMPNTSPEALQGVVTSGKTLKAIYWPLIVRCDEKMLSWRPALEFIAKTIIEGAKLYPESAKPYIVDQIPDTMEYSVYVENQYPLPEEESEEKTIDVMEVNANVMSKKSYMKKWRGLTDEEADAEIEQIAKEARILEQGYFPTTDGNVGEGEEV